MRKVPARKCLPWFNEEIASAKRLRCHGERKWRKSGLESDRIAFVKERSAVSKLIFAAKRKHYLSIIEHCYGNQKALFKIVDGQMHKSRMPALPQHDSPKDLADQFMDFFISKTTKIKATLQNSTSNQDYLPTLPVCPVPVKLSEFELVSTETVAKLVRSSKSKTCPLDPLPTNLVKECIDVLAPMYQQMINLSLSSAVVPGHWKAGLISPILKKPGLDVVRENFRPISDLEFVGKLCEKVVSAQLVKHVNDNSLNNVFQSAYKAGHSTETALARVLNDMLCSIDERRVTILVLLDLSAAFDTVVHDILLHCLCHHFGVTGRALDWFRSYLTSRSERVTVIGTCS